MNSNKCMYCGSTAYGPGCPFSPHGKHVHPSDPKRCIYCGSYAVGPGCPFNPFSTVHVHGVEFNQMVNDSVENGVVIGYLMKTLSEPITETSAYKLGIIDENGNKLKNPETPEEHAAYSVIDDYINNLKQVLGNKIDLVNNVTEINLESSIDMALNLNQYAAQEEMKQKFQNVINQLYELTVESNQKGLNKAIIEKLIIESFMSKK